MWYENCWLSCITRIEVRFKILKWNHVRSSVMIFVPKLTSFVISSGYDLLISVYSRYFLSPFLFTTDKITLNAIPEPPTAVDEDSRPPERCAESLNVPDSSKGRVTIIFKVKNSKMSYSWTLQSHSITFQRNWNVETTLLLGALAELRKATISFIMSAPRGTTRLPLDEFSWNYIFECFSNICREYWRFIKICQI
jgi:hypothetical protein